MRSSLLHLRKYKRLPAAIASSAVALVFLLATGTPRLFADTIVGGVDYSITVGETDSATTTDVILTMDTTNAVDTSVTLSSFALQFNGATNVTIEDASNGTWTVQQGSVNNPTGCNLNSSATNSWCFTNTGSALPVGPGYIYTFTFDVTMPLGTSLPSSVHIQAFQGTALAISDDSPITTPEPSSMMLLGIGLIGLAWFARRRITLFG